MDGLKENICVVIHIQHVIKNKFNKQVIEMKTIKILLLIIICSAYSNLYSQEERWPIKRGTQDYIVEKIDSMYSYYLIYVSRNNRVNTYRLVEKKNDSINCNSKIVVGKVYKLTIHGNEDAFGPVIGYEYPVEVEEGFLPLELEWGYDLYYADEIEGLCYKEIILQNNNRNDWLEDSVGCLKKRSPELSEKLIKENNLENCSIEKFKKVFGEPNKIHVDSTNNRIELTYYFDSFCKDGRIDLGMDYCWIEYIFIKNKLIDKILVCI